MSERYKKLYHLEHRLYASHAPILIESGALLLEQQSGAMLCQLCFRNIQDLPVKSLRAVVQLLDARGKPLGNPVDHRYADLELKRDEKCGGDSAIVLPACAASSFRVQIAQVSLADGQLWAEEEARWLPLPDQLRLEDEQADPAEVRRCRRRFGADIAFLPVSGEELWFCVCGAVNAREESRCHCCRRRRSFLLGERVASPTAEDREEESLRAWREPAEPKPRRKGGLIAAAALVLLGLLALLLLPRIRSDPERKDLPAEAALPAEETAEEQDPRQGPYERALALQEKADYAPLEDAAGLYEEAARAFEELGDYEDSAQRAEECRQAVEEQRLSLLRSDYEDAAALMEEGAYAEARQAFLALGSFEDSAEQAKEAVFRKACALYDYVQSVNVKGLRASLSTEPGEESLVALPRERLLEMGSAGTRELEACFGRDPVRLVALEEAGEDMLPLEEAISQMLLPLGDYKNSIELALLLPTLIDRSDEFFELCASGDLAAAYDWLRTWHKPFEDRELWMERLQRYLPYCQSWSLVVGDASLVPMIGGQEGPCYDFRIQVIFTREQAILRFLLNEGDETGPELLDDLDDERYPNNAEGVQYLLQRNDSGSLCILKLEGTATVGAVEYEPAG